MAKELMEIGGFITSGAEIVNHDASLSGNGTVDSPLGLNNEIVNSGSFDVNKTYFSGGSYVDWYELSNGMCRIRGWLRPTTAIPGAWNFFTFASGGPSAFFNDSIIPTLIDWEGWADYINWKDNGSLTFLVREVVPTASNRLINFDYLGLNRKAQ